MSDYYDECYDRIIPRLRPNHDAIDATWNRDAMEEANIRSVTTRKTVFVPPSPDASGWSIVTFGPILGRSPSSAAFVGAGPRKSIFRLDESCPGPIWACVHDGSWHDGIMQGVGFQGHSQTTEPLLKVAGYSCTMRDIWVRAGGSSGIEIFAGQRFILDNVEAELSLGGVGIHVHGAIGVTMIGCNGEGNEQAGILIEPAVGKSRGCAIDIIQPYLEMSGGIELRGVVGCRVSSPWGSGQKHVVKLTNGAHGNTLFNVANGIVDIQEGCWGNSVEYIYGVDIRDHDGRNRVSKIDGAELSVSKAGDPNITEYTASTDPLTLGKQIYAGSEYSNPAWSIVAGASTHAAIAVHADTVGLYDSLQFDSLDIPASVDTVYLYLLTTCHPSNDLIITAYDLAHGKHYDFNADGWGDNDQSPMRVAVTGQTQWLRIPFKTQGAARRIRARICVGHGSGKPLRIFHYQMSSQGDLRSPSEL